MQSPVEATARSRTLLVCISGSRSEQNWHAAVVTAPGPTGNASVKYIDKYKDYNLPYQDQWRSDPAVIKVEHEGQRVDPQAYAVASANESEIDIQFRDYGNTYTKSIAVKTHRTDEGNDQYFYATSGANTLNVKIPIQFTNGAAQTPHQIDINANMFSGAISIPGVQSWFDYVTSITGTDSSGTQYKLLDMHTAPNSAPCPLKDCATPVLTKTLPCQQRSYIMWISTIFH